LYKTVTFVFADYGSRKKAKRTPAGGSGSKTTPQRRRKTAKDRAKKEATHLVPGDPPAPATGQPKGRDNAAPDVLSTTIPLLPTSVSIKKPPRKKGSLLAEVIEKLVDRAINKIICK